MGTGWLSTEALGARTELAYLEAECRVAAAYQGQHYIQHVLWQRERCAGLNQITEPTQGQVHRVVVAVLCKVNSGDRIRSL